MIIIIVIIIIITIITIITIIVLTTLFGGMLTPTCTLIIHVLHVRQDVATSMGTGGRPAGKANSAGGDVGQLQ